MIDQFTAFDAERLRQRHCDNTERGLHQCVGVMTVKPGICQFDCTLCGHEFVVTPDAAKSLEELESRHTGYVLKQVHNGLA